MAGAVIMATLANVTAAIATKPFARRLIANSPHARPAIWPLTTRPTIRIPLLCFAATPRIRYLEDSLKPHVLRKIDQNDIRADFGATWQIRYTTIHDRLRIGGRLYELRPFAMRACVVKTPLHYLEPRGRGVSTKSSLSFWLNYCRAPARTRWKRSHRADASEYTGEGRYGGTFAARVATAIRTLHARPHDPHPPAYR